jgi:hypothetical protein
LASALISARKLALLLLLKAPDSTGRPGRPLAGITRLQKLLFLVWTKLGRVSPARGIKVDFDYTPQRFGPADIGLYADLEFLVALGHIRRSSTPTDRFELDFQSEGATQLNLDDVLASESEATQQESRDELSLEEATETEISFEYLMGDEEVAADLAAGERTEDWFSITKSGLKLLEQIELHLESGSHGIFGRLQGAAYEARRTYGDWPLPRLLRFVYSNYPNMISESEIKNKVLGTS